MARNSLLSQAEFRLEVEAERARLARGRRVSSVLALDLGEPAASALRRLERDLAAALRSIDRVGWNGPKQLAVLLPGTAPDAAQQVLERLLSVTGAASGAVRAVSPAPAPTRSLARTQHAESTLAADRVRCESNGVFALVGSPLPGWKRALDVVVASIALALLAPLLACIALAIRLGSAGSPVFRQRRTGQGMQRFWIYKFRTMRRGADRELAGLAERNEMSGPLFKSALDPRITRIGRVLRRTSLDELPQLVNVLQGDMTLLGPRALSPKPEDYEAWQLRRFLVRPGIACDWQATRRGDVDFDAWMRSDLAYVDRGTAILSDLALLVRTSWAVLTCAGGR